MDEGAGGLLGGGLVLAGDDLASLLVDGAELGLKLLLELVHLLVEGGLDLDRLDLETLEGGDARLHLGGQLRQKLLNTAFTSTIYGYFTRQDQQKTRIFHTCDARL